MTTKACDSCFHGNCERCTSLLCACCGEREVATVSTFVPFNDEDEDFVDYDDSFIPYDYESRILL